MKRTIKLRESELRRMIDESVKSVLNEIGDTDDGQDVLGQVYGRALRRAQMLGDKGAASRRLRKIAHDAEEKAYSEREKHNLVTGFSKFDDGITTGYAKAKNNEAINRKIDMIVSETLKRALNEVMSPEDKWVADEEADEDRRYEIGELNKAFQKANNTYQATSSDGNFKTGDKVIVHTRKGDIEGVITDFDVNFMTYKETADVEYNENGRTRTLLGCPLDKIEKIG